MTKYTEIPLYLRPFTQLLRKRPCPWSGDNNDQPPLKKPLIEKESKDVKTDKLIKSEKEDKFISDFIIYCPH